MNKASHSYNRLLLAFLGVVFFIILRASFIYADDSKVYFGITEAGDYLREHFMNHETEIKVNLYYPDDISATVWKDLYNEAVKHTGKPNEGDYLNTMIDHYQANGYSEYVSAKYPATNGSITYTSGYIYRLTYEVKYRTTKAQEQRVDSEISRILTSLKLSGKSDYEKVSTIYDYICKNIRYDYTHLNDKTYRIKYTAYAGLFDKTCVCQGYAQLLYRMLLEEGIDCRSVGGNTVKDGVITDPDTGHIWNIVRLDGKYYNVDATWDEGQKYYKYFLLSDESFHVDHKRKEQFVTAEFYAKYPMSAVDDPFMPDVKGDCGANGSNLKWTYNNSGTLTISGKGEMANFTSGGQPWVMALTKIKRVVVEEGVTSLGEYAFYNCRRITDVKLPTTLVKMGAAAFSRCTSLKELTLNSTKMHFGQFMFWNSSSFTTLIYPGSKTEFSKNVVIDKNNDELMAAKIKYHTHELPSKPYKTTNATCTEGKSEVYKCKTCSKDVKKELSKALGHRIVTDKAVQPTYTKAGLTEGSHCSRCKEILVQQVKLPMKALDRVKISSLENKSKGISIKWGKVTGAAGYYVYRDGKLIATIKKGTTVSYTDALANTAGKKYTYTIKAYKGKNIGPESEKKTITRSKAPTIKSASNTDRGAITVTWDKNLKNNVEIKIVCGTYERHFYGAAANGSYKCYVSDIGKTYKVYIRTYYAADGQYVYSDWSSAKSCKVIK